jgi:hypothetical protein
MGSSRDVANGAISQPEGEGSNGDVDDLRATDDTSLRTELRPKKCGEGEAGGGRWHHA